MHITPKVRAALIAIANDPAQSLRRCCGGYRPASAPPGPAPVFTKRTVNVMERDYLVAFDDHFMPDAKLTSKGKRVATEIRAAA